MGPEKVEMPNVIGSTRDDAAQKLTQVGLNASFWPIYNDGSYVPGCVAYCSEEVGTMLDVGTSVVVYIAAEVEATVPVTPEVNVTATVVSSPGVTVIFPEAVSGFTVSPLKVNFAFATEDEPFKVIYSAFSMVSDALPSLTSASYMSPVE